MFQLTDGLLNFFTGGILVSLLCLIWNDTNRNKKPQQRKDLSDTLDVNKAAVNVNMMWAGLSGGHRAIGNNWKD